MPLPLPGGTCALKHRIRALVQKWYRTEPPPRSIPPPPEGACPIAKRFIAMLNQGTEEIGCWDEFVRTKKVHSRDRGSSQCALAPVRQGVSNTVAGFPENRHVTFV